MRRRLFNILAAVSIDVRVAMCVLCTLVAPAVFGWRPAYSRCGAIRFTYCAYLYAARFSAGFPYLNLPLPVSPNGANGVRATP